MTHSTILEQVLGEGVWGGGDCLCVLDFSQTFAKFKFLCTNPRQTTATAPPIIHGLGYKNWEPPIYSVTVTLASVQFNHRTSLEPPIYSVTVTLDVMQINARTTYSAVLQLEYSVTLFLPGKKHCYRHQNTWIILVTCSSQLHSVCITSGLLNV